MTRVLNFSDQQIAQLRVLHSAPPKLFSDVLIAINSVDRRTVRVSALLDAVTAQLPESTSFANTVVQMSVMLSTVARRAGMSKRDLQSALAITAAKHLSVDSDGDKRWQIMAELAFAEVVYLSGKALDLTFDFERLFTTAKVITDVRPVYNEEATEVMGAVIVQNLQLEFLRSDRFETFSLALDSKDIRSLIEALKKALQKQEVATRLPQLKEAQIFVAGEERNDADG